MSDIFVSVQAGDVSNACYRSEQERYLDYLLKTVWKVRLGDTTGILIQEAQPAVEDNDKIWYKRASDGGLEWPALPFAWNINYSQWLATHPIPPGDNGLRIWIGAAVDIDDYDGGETAGISPSTGPMWEIVTDFNDRIPAGVGTNVAAVNTDYDIFPAAASGGPVQARGVYLIQRTARIYYRR